MRILSLLIAIAAAAAAACTTKRNEGVCCVSAADCAALGVDEPRPCGPGQACQGFACVAAECATSAECTSPGAPVCIDQLCVAACRVDADCAGAASGARCAEDGACVGCFSHADCPASAPLCDAEDRRCRGCEADAECASSVCIEADAVCAPGESAVVYVRSGGADTGDCPASAPCASLAYALEQVTPARQIIHLAGSAIGGATVTITKSVVIDGTRTQLVTPTTGPALDVRAGAVVVVEGIEMLGQSGAPAITVDHGRSLRLYDVKLDQAAVRVTNSAIELRKGRLKDTAIDCTSGTVTIRESQLDMGAVTFSSCQTLIERNRFELGRDGSISGTGGLLSVKNNVFVVSSEFVDLITVGGHAPGSVIGFNTIMNISLVTSDPIAISCDSTVTLTSNIVAYNSTNPLVGCAARFSLFDLPGAPAAAGNTSADVATFFRNRATGDFRPAANSPALGAGEPGVVSKDFDGRARSDRPDIGAFEAP